MAPKKKTEALTVNGFFIGSLLGDGCFVKKSENHNTYCVFKHAEDQRGYLNWKYQFLKSHGCIKETSKGVVKVNIKEGSCFPNNQDQYKFATKSLPELNRYKTMTDSEIVSEFDETAFVIWMLDDGNVYKECVKISCGSKSTELCDGLVEKIKSFGLEAVMYHHPTNKSKNYIRIPAKSFKKVKEMIEERIDENLDVLECKVGGDVLEIKVKYHDPELGKLEFVGGEKSDWIDLRSAERVDLEPNQFRIISLGVSMKLPEGYEAHVLPRSSTFKKWGILMVNSMGVIDESYCGENDVWGFPALAMRQTTIFKGDRICQFRIVKKMPEVKFTEVERMTDADRGGFGSSGHH